MLGFRGNRAGNPDVLRAWGDAVEPRITTGRDRGYDLPAAQAPPGNVPLPVARDKLRKLVLTGAILAGVFLLRASFALVTLRNR